MTEDYDQKVKELQEENETYLKGFKEQLQDKGLSKKTVNLHVSNADFYINYFLLYYDADDVKEGAYQLYSFFGSWFNRKAPYASSGTVKSTAASIKKFYAYLLDVSVVDQDAYDDVCETIKECMPDWLEEVQEYSDRLDDIDSWFQYITLYITYPFSNLNPSH